MEKIIKQIKEDSYSNCYLLYGNEAYLKKLYKLKLKQGIIGDDDMNYSYYDGKDIPLQEINDISQTIPFFSERRLIIIENSQLFKSAAEYMEKIIKNIPDSTYILFIENEINKKNRLYKLIQDMGYVCEMKTQTERKISDWLLRVFGKSKKKITKEAMAYFLASTGLDMENISNEAEKLISYKGDDTEITLEDIKAVCMSQTVDRIFDMMNAIGAKDKDKAIRLYGDLLSLKEAPLKILALLSRHFAILLAIKELKEERYSNDTMAKKVSVPSYFIGRYITQSNGFTKQQLRRFLEECVEAEQHIKTGVADDKYIIEMIIIKCIIS